VGNEREKILLTGASGFVGKAVRKELKRAEKYEIIGFVGGKRGLSQDLPSAGKVFQVDIAEYKSFPAAPDLKDTRVIVHCAGMAHQFGNVGREAFERVNVQGTENACRMAREIGAGHFILISSVAVYGHKHGGAVIDESYDCQPEGFYAESKLAAERRAIEYCRKYKIALTVLRLATVIGEGDRGNTARLITQIDRRRFFWIGDGSNLKTLIYHGDVAKSIRKIIESKPVSGVEIYNLAAKALTMREIVETICYHLRKKTLPIAIPDKWVRGALRRRPAVLSGGKLERIESTIGKWLASDVFSGAKFTERFDFPMPTPVTAALGLQVAAYMRRKKNKSGQKT